MGRINCCHDVEGRCVVYHTEDKDWADKLFRLCHNNVPGAERVVTNRGHHGVRSAETRDVRQCRLWLEAGEIGDMPERVNGGIAVRVIKAAT